MALFKDIIKKLRTEKNITQETLASELGKSKSTVAMWETGDRTPSPEVYEELADYFNVDMDYLYGRTNIKKKVHFDSKGNSYYYFNQETKDILESVEQIMSSDNEFHQKLVKTVATASEEDLKALEHLMRYLMK